MGIASLVLGILSVFTARRPYVSIPFAALGIVFGVLAQGDRTQAGLGKAGAFCAIVAVVLVALYMVACVACVSTGMFFFLF